jgi:hypothetical protein
MKIVWGRFWLGILMLTLLIPRPGGAQDDTAASTGNDQGGSKAVTRIALGSTTAANSESVVLPVYFTPGEGVEVGHLTMRVNFVSANLKFEKIERGIAAELGKLDLSNEVTAGKNEKDVETTTVTISAGVPSSETGKKGMAAGLLAYLLLKVSDTARPASITLRTTAEATELGTKKVIDKLQVTEGVVEVQAPGSLPVVSCFFFTH